jgi:hypothetical protein
MLATVIGTKDNPTLGPRDGGIVDGEPRHAEDDWVVAEARDVELDVLCVRTNLELDREGFLGDGAGQDRAAVNHLEISRLGLEPEADGVGLSKLDIDKAR